MLYCSYVLSELAAWAHLKRHFHFTRFWHFLLCLWFTYLQSYNMSLHCCYLETIYSKL
jgi:hypothetical protein